MRALSVCGIRRDHVLLFIARTRALSLATRARHHTAIILEYVNSQTEQRAGPDSTQPYTALTARSTALLSCVVVVRAYATRVP